MMDDYMLATMFVEAVDIPEGRRFDGKPFPLTLSPIVPSLRLTEWTQAHRQTLLSLVSEYDAVLLRGFADAASADDFSQFAASLKLGDFEMGCSAAPRTNVAPGVFTANEAPPTEPIPFHHEMCGRREPIPVQPHAGSPSRRPPAALKTAPRCTQGPVRQSAIARAVLLRGAGR